MNFIVDAWAITQEIIARRRAGRRQAFTGCFRVHIARKSLDIAGLLSRSPDRRSVFRDHRTGPIEPVVHAYPKNIFPVPD
jgi:hypothetical protein